MRIDYLSKRESARIWGYGLAASSDLCRRSHMRRNPTEYASIKFLYSIRVLNPRRVLNSHVDLTQARLATLTLAQYSLSQRMRDVAMKGTRITIVVLSAFTILLLRRATDQPGHSDRPVQFARV